MVRLAGRVAPDPVASGPIQAHVRLGRLGGSGRGGGCSESDHLPSQNVSSQAEPTGHQLVAITTTTHADDAADVKTSSTGAGVVPHGGAGTRQYAIKAGS